MREKCTPPFQIIQWLLNFIILFKKPNKNVKIHSRLNQSTGKSEKYDQSMY